MKAFKIKLTEGSEVRIYEKDQENAEIHANFFFGGRNVESVTEETDPAWKKVIRESYEISDEGQTTGSYYAQSGFSEYNNRWRKYHDGTLPAGEMVYGLEQARQHIAELRESVYEGKQIRKESVFYIRKVTTITETVDVLEPTK